METDMGLYADRIFPWLLDRVTRGVYRDREALLREASGRVLEIGVGTGINLPLYDPAKVTEVVGIEPSAAMLEKARERIREAAVKLPVRLQQASAEALPFRDASFDSIIACLVFCTIPDARRATAEMVRVLRPGGRVLVFEHTRSPERPVARWQDRIDPLWSRVACGCHINRSTRHLFEEMGLKFQRIDSYYHPKMGSRISAHVITGIATRAPDGEAVSR